MRDYEEFPDTLSLNALFYIGNPQNLNIDTLRKLHGHFVRNKQFFSLEKLIKGGEQARVLFGSREMVHDYPELALVELEDYISDESSFFSQEDFEKRVSVNQVISWLIEPKNNPKKLLLVGNELRDLKVENTQKVFIQSVLMPVDRSGEPVFQTTLRVMVADSDPIKRVELAKNINQIISTATGLKKHEDAYPEGKKFESFKQRSLIPKEVSEFILTADEVLSIIS